MSALTNTNPYAAPHPTNPRLSPPVHTDWSRDPRHNALVHGLTANFPLDDEEHRIMAEEIDTWTRELGPTCEAESAIIHAAAIARVRIFRAARAESAALRLARKHAEANHTERQRKRVRKVAQSLADETCPTLDRLEATRHGREYLGGRWRNLDAILLQGLLLTADHRKQVMNLLGFRDAAPGPDAPPFIRLAWAHLLQAQNAGPCFEPHATAEFAYVALRGFQPPEEVPADAVEARRWLRGLCARERARLAELEQKAAELGEEAASEQYEAELRAEVDLVQNTPEAVLRRRYAREADQSLRASVNLLMRIRQDRRKAEDDERKVDRRRPQDEPRPRRPEPDWQPAGSDSAEPATETTPAPLGASPCAPSSLPFPAGNAERRTRPAPTAQPDAQVAPPTSPNHQPHTQITAPTTTHETEDHPSKLAG